MQKSWFVVLLLIVQRACASFRLPISVLERSATLTLQDVYGLQLTNFGDIEYYSTIVVGNPKQEFRVVLDTGSTQLWIMSRECRVGKNRRCAKHRLFDSSRSSSFIAQEGRFRINYEIGFSAGRYGKDEVALGTIEHFGLLTPNLTLGIADRIDQETQVDVIDGILGLGFPRNQDPESLINRAIREHRLERPLYTIYVEKVGGDNHKPGGEILFGEVDNKRCSSIVTYAPLTTTRYWQVTARKVAIAGKLIARNLEVVSDTGTSSLVMPKKDFEQVMKAVGLPANIGGLPYVSGRMKFVLELWIRNVRFTLTAQELMVRYSDGCVLEIDITSWKNDKSWVLGDPFARAYCTIHDLGQKRIGFARAKVSRNYKRNQVAGCGKKCQNALRTQPKWIASALRPPLDDSADPTPAPMYDPIEEEYLDE